MSLVWPGPRFHLKHRKAKQLYQGTVAAHLRSQHRRGTRTVGLTVSLAALDSATKKNYQ